MIFITGAGGQLGTILLRKVSELTNEVCAPTHSQMDITEKEQVDRWFDEYKPSVVFHCASFAKVDLAESQRELCLKTNVLGTQNIIDACRRMNAYLVFISSDYVFDGKKNSPYNIDDKCNPLSVYGQSKEAGEKLVKAYDNSVVVRTSWLFGSPSNNFVEAIYKLGKTQKELNVVCDQIGSPTYIDDLCDALISVAQKRIRGILHITNEGYCTRADLARKILELSHSPCIVHDVTEAEFPSAAVRPYNSRLNKECLDAAGIQRLPSWEDGMARYLKKK